MDPDLTTDVAAHETPHLALYRRWRAQTFSRIVGQDAVVTTLRNAVRTGQVAHALLFVGPRGTGKTSMARIVAKALNCTNLQDGDPCDSCQSCVAIRDGRTLDVSELDAATNNKVDQIRELVERTWTAPSDLRRKVFIIDEVQRIDQGWDVLLKTLEEPPPHVVFIFCTTDPTRIRPAVLSRVQRFEFRRLTVPQIEGKLSTILAADGREADPEAIALVARQAAGGMRDAESMLDQLLSSSAERLTVDAVRDLLGLVDAEIIDAFLGALVRGDALTGITVLDGLDEAGRDLSAFMDQLVVALRGSLTTALAGGSTVDPTHGVAELTAAARRIAAIDPSRQGAGGLRFQLELALIAAAAGSRPAGVGQTVRVTASPRPAAPPPTAALPETAEPVPPKADPRPSLDPVAKAPAHVTQEPPPVAQAPASADSALEPVEQPAEPNDPPPTRPVPAPVSAEPVPAAAAPAPAADPAQAAIPADAADPADASLAAGRPRGSRRVESGTPGVASPAPDTDDPLRELARVWPSIVAELSKSPPIKPIIEDCRPIAFDGAVVTIGFPEGKSFLKDVAERRRPTLEEGIGRALGRAVAVRLVATNLDLLPPPADEEAERVLAAARRIFADDLVDAGEVG